MEEMQVLTDLINRERAGERCTITVGPYGLYLMITAMQLATRHPQLSPHLLAQLFDLGQDVQAQFASPNNRAAFELLARGWDLTEDR